MEIPKIIHYCWYGGKPLPAILRYCISSWKKHLPDYEFMLWNEDNTSFDTDFIKKACEEKKWAFVSDYVRLKAIYDYGGIYLDTDMLILEPLDFFLDNESFFVAEHKNSIGVGVFGAHSNNQFIENCLEYYSNYNGLHEAIVPIPKVVTDAFEDKYKMENVFENDIFLDGLTIYQESYFYALPYSKLFDIHNYEYYLKDNSYGLHLWFGSWHSYNELMLIRRKEYKKAIKKILKTVFVDKRINYKYIKKLASTLKDSVQVKNAFRE